MKNKYKFLVFCFVGFSSFLIDLFFFNIFFAIHFGFIFSRIFAAGLSMIFNFNVNRNFTFKAGDKNIKHQIWKWLLVYFISIFVNISVGYTILQIIGESTLNANIAAIIGIGFSIPVGFFGSLLWVFKKAF